MQTHTYDVVIVGAGGAGMRAALESGPRARTAVLTKLYPTRSHTGAAQGGMCAALANVEEDNWEWHTFDTVKGGDYLVDQDAAEIMCKEAIDAVIDLEKMGLPFNRTPEGRIDQRRFGGHTRNHGEAAVRRACYAADRTGHMILQTLYQNCVKQGVEFYNEFYVLDLLLNEVDGETRTAGVVAYELSTGEIHIFQAKSVVFATGGFGKVFKTTSNAHTLTGDGMAHRLPPGPAAGGHGVLPVPPDGPGRPRRPAHRGRPRRGRHPAQRLRRALHGALRPHHQGPRPARHGRPRDGPGGPRGPRRRSEQGLRLPRPHAPAAPRRSRRSCPTSPSSRAPTWASTRSPSWCRCSRPRTTRWAASRPTSNAEVLRRQRPRRPRPVRRRRVRLRRRCTAPTAWAPTRCSTSTCSAAGPASPPRSTPRPPTSSTCPTTPGRPASRPWSSQLRRQHRRPSASPTSAGPCRRRWTSTRRSTAPRRRSRRRSNDVRALRARLRATSRIHDKGARYNTDLLEAIELGFLLDLAELLVVGALARKESPRRARPRGLPDPRRRELHGAHHGLPRCRPGRIGVDPPGLQARHQSPATSRWSASTDGHRRPHRPRRRGRRHRHPAAVPRHGPPPPVPARRGPASRTGRTSRSTCSRPTGSSTPCTRSSGSRTAR